MVQQVNLIRHGGFTDLRAAALVGDAPQNLRLYEARGLVAPARSQGGTRLYSENDLERLRVIAKLLDGGLNLAGIQMVLVSKKQMHGSRGNSTREPPSKKRVESR